MLPSAIIQLDKLPRLPNGKLDIKALPVFQGSINTGQSDHIPPRNTIEQQLADIWEQVLDFNPVSIHDNFFEIGGDSILSIQVVTKIRKAGLDLAPHQLFEHQTIAELAPFLKPQVDQPTRSISPALVPMQTTGPKPPLFYIHVGGGHALFYHPLTKHLAPDQPVYALQPLGLNGEVMYQSIEELATHYLEIIRDTHPQGPFTILGTCYGNPVCAEIAIQLRQRGELIPTIFIVDSAPGHLVSRKDRNEPTRMEMRIDRFKERFQKDPFYAIWRLMIGGLKQTIQTLAQKLNYLQTRYGGDSEARDTILTEENLIKLYHKYTWKPFNSKIILIRSHQKAQRMNSMDVPIWEGLAQGGVEILSVPGTHPTLFKEDVKGLAQCVQNYMDESYKQ